ncbi:pyrroline-5-carboxylate reductase [Novosphingobium flavum]|uniref:Pyrroline-5-carboxylate reductase n=1 Tax=Novosphingobium aerophilum TaxID=2839843 RepID=A0A7X1F605_9SPHN|nr:pyrroline-5-carboxylate reductase dimerization domain-containing protein [Novosphingobium aerophilum]MBC2651000.1 pyrroline-5-carboxylate reductase [Novosphingobium aerophilum]MBC2663703.1 pyrroline-5-carboxylate reductase [Novosphingobium aerophilum]
MRMLQIGCGNMGGAMLAGWLAGGMAADGFTVVDPVLAEAPPGVRLLRQAPSGEAPFDMLLLGFKPQQFTQIAPGLEPLAGEGTVVLSVLAGVELATLRARFPRARGIVRVMPNLAAALGKSPIGLVGEVDEADRAAVDRLMAPLGQAEWLVDEETMHLVTALAGSGPAFVYRMIDALAAGAAALGLPRDQADRLALSMVEGAAALAAASEHSPGELADRVASPGGVTRAGMNVLDAENRMLALMTDTLRAARDRNIEMAEEARAAG